MFREFKLDREYSTNVDKKRQKMVETSYYKYGSARDNFGGGRVDAFQTAERCMDAFKKDNNLEHLYDAMNYLMFRIMFPYPGDDTRFTDSNGSIGTVGIPINMEDNY